MIRINQLKLPVGHSESALRACISNLLKLGPDTDFSYEIAKRSIDARRKPEIYFVYSIYVSVDNEKRRIKRLNRPSIVLADRQRYRFPKPGKNTLTSRPVVVGAGPAGLFAAFQLAEAGYAPIVLERGKCVSERSRDVEEFWNNGNLLANSNVLFGEGGAGAFSDGKLNTAVKDPTGRNAYVLDTFVRFGAPEEIRYESKPHIGTDVLRLVIENMRIYLQKRGATFFFETTVTEIGLEHGCCVGVFTERGFLAAELVVLAPGHSARDTFVMLDAHHIPMETKNFAVGFRVEHPQLMIDEAMYARAHGGILPAAPYKLTSNFPGKRGVYSFCMCPGGYVVNASSEAHGTCVNGMSYAARDGANANSAIIVSVTAADFKADGPLAGMHYQRHLEQACYALGNGRIVQQLYGDFVQNTISTAYGDFASQTKGAAVFANLRGLLSSELEQAFINGMTHFSRIIKNFDRNDAILSGMETRTSSPVRILRNAAFESAVTGLYPCGEGAGYAGGIMSAAIDGLKVASAIMQKYAPPLTAEAHFE